MSLEFFIESERISHEVAVRVMGLSKLQAYRQHPPYAENLENAWFVVEKLSSLVRWKFESVTHDQKTGKLVWQVSIHDTSGLLFTLRSTLLAEGICLAALDYVKYWRQKDLDRSPEIRSTSDIPGE